MTDSDLPAVVILSTADFHADVWTNKQHLASRLAEHTPVTYVESFGLRRPRVQPADAARIARRLRRGRASDGAVLPDNLEVISPVVVPLHDWRAVRRLNTRLVNRLDIPNLGRSVLWTFSPVTYGLERRAKAVVYHAVDLLHTQPRASAGAILDGERQLVRTADVVVASSAGVRAHLRSLGREDVLLWENVADTELFSAAVSSTRQRRAVFAGNLTSTKVSGALLTGVADAGIDVVVAGPIAIDGADGPRAFETVLRHPRITYVGNRTPAELAQLFKASMVGLIPYELNEYTAGVFPLKVYEYLAAGLGVVSTRLPSLAGRDDPGLVCRDGEAFVEAVVAAIDGFSDEAAAARSQAAAGHSWSRRASDAMELLRAI